MAISPMTKDKVMRPSLIDSVDKINELVSDANDNSSYKQLHFGMRKASQLGLTPTNDNLSWYYNTLGTGVFFFWIDGANKLVNQPASWGTLIMTIMDDRDMCQIYFATNSKAYFRVTNAEAGEWKSWAALN